MAKIKCFTCSKIFERSKAEINRNKKIGRKTFCSRSCSGKETISNIPIDKRGNADHLKKGMEKDEFSPFRFFIKLCKMRKKQKSNLEFNITLEDLKEQWEKQNGVCPYTGWKMKIADCQTNLLKKTPDRASLDRIDSSRGYIKDNIQFVSLIVQYAKNDWEGEVVFEFADAVKNYRY